MTILPLSVRKRKERHEGGGAPSGFSRFPNPEGESDEEEDFEREKRKRSEFPMKHSLHLNFFYIELIVY